MESFIFDWKLIRKKDENAKTRNPLNRQNSCSDAKDVDLSSSTANSDTLKVRGNSNRTEEFPEVHKRRQSFLDRPSSTPICPKTMEDSTKDGIITETTPKRGEIILNHKRFENVEGDGQSAELHHCISLEIEKNVEEVSEATVPNISQKRDSRFKSSSAEKNVHDFDKIHRSYNDPAYHFDDETMTSKIKRERMIDENNTHGFDKKHISYGDLTDEINMEMIWTEIPKLEKNRNKNLNLCSTAENEDASSSLTTLDDSGLENDERDGISSKAAGNAEKESGKPVVSEDISFDPVKYHNRFPSSLDSSNYPSDTSSSLKTLGDALKYFGLSTRLKEFEKSLEDVRRHKQSKEDHENCFKLFDKDLLNLSRKYHPDKVKAQGGSLEELEEAQKLQTALNATRTVLSFLNRIFLEELDVDHKIEFYTSLNIGTMGNEEEVENHAYEVLFKISYISEIKQQYIIAEIFNFLTASKSSIECFINDNEWEFNRNLDLALYHLKKCVKGYEKLIKECNEVENEPEGYLQNIHPVIQKMKQESLVQLNVLNQLRKFSGNSAEKTFQLFECQKKIDEYFVLPFVLYTNLMLMCNNVAKRKTRSFLKRAAVYLGWNDNWQDYEIPEIYWDVPYLSNAYYLARCPSVDENSKNRAIQDFRNYVSTISQNFEDKIKTDFYHKRNAKNPVMEDLKKCMKLADSFQRKADELHRDIQEYNRECRELREECEKIGKEDGKYNKEFKKDLDDRLDLLENFLKKNEEFYTAIRDAAEEKTDKTTLNPTGLENVEGDRNIMELDATSSEIAQKGEVENKATVSQKNNSPLKSFSDDNNTHGLDESQNTTGDRTYYSNDETITVKTFQEMVVMEGENAKPKENLLRDEMPCSASKNEDVSYNISVLLTSKIGNNINSNSETLEAVPINTQSFLVSSDCFSSTPFAQKATENITKQKTIQTNAIFLNDSELDNDERDVISSEAARKPIVNEDPSFSPSSFGSSNYASDASSILKTLGDVLKYFGLSTRLIELGKSLEDVRRHKKSKEDHENSFKLFDKDLLNLSIKYKSDQTIQEDSAEDLELARKFEAAIDATRTVLSFLNRRFLEQLNVYHKFEFYSSLSIDSMGNEEEVKNQVHEVLLKIRYISEIKQQYIIAEIFSFLTSSKSSIAYFMKDNECEFHCYLELALSHLRRCVKGYEKLIKECNELEKEPEGYLQNIHPVIQKMKQESLVQLNVLNELNKFAENSTENTFRFFPCPNQMDDYFVLPFVLYINLMLMCNSLTKLKTKPLLKRATETIGLDKNCQIYQIPQIYCGVPHLTNAYYLARYASGDKSRKNKVIQDFRFYISNISKDFEVKFKTDFYRKRKDKKPVMEDL